MTEMLEFTGSQTQGLLAERYGVSQVTIHAIRAGKSWKHVDG